MAPIPTNGSAVLQQLNRASIDSFAESRSIGSRANALPVKSANYFINRYFDHPIYHYEVHGISIDVFVSGVVVSRLVFANQRKALRLVDYYGSDETFSQCGSAIALLHVNNGAEYADLFCLGLSEQAVHASGFAEVIANGPVIVPNHFEPFDAGTNDIINYAVLSDQPVVLFRADGDQDRPNQAPTI